MNELHLRIARVTDDLRNIQQELNCAAMQAPSDPELMEALDSLSETEPIEILRSALDQMRHFLWFYSQVMDNEPELGDKFGKPLPPNRRTPNPPAMRRQNWKDLFSTSFRVATRSSCSNTSPNPNAASRTRRSCLPTVETQFAAKFHLCQT